MKLDDDVVAGAREFIDSIIDTLRREGMTSSVPDEDYERAVLKAARWSQQLRDCTKKSPA